jgi:drug/metabolite transporter (DMT)-like permease
MALAIHSNALLALSSAASWGGGDFSGGMGVKASGGRAPEAIRFVLLAHIISLVALVTIALSTSGILSRKTAHRGLDSALHRRSEDTNSGVPPRHPAKPSRIRRTPWQAIRAALPQRKAVMQALHSPRPHGAAAPDPLRRSLDPRAASAWATLAGLTGALGLVAFYIALSRGGMGISAALSGLLAAAIPAVTSSRIEGAPSGLRLAGFVLAGGAIWFIAAEDSPESKVGSHRSLALALFSGVMFGVYFIALKMANPLGLVASMAIARLTSVTLCSLVLGALTISKRCVPAYRQAQQTAPKLSTNWLVVWGWASAVALLDTGGNLLFMAATRMGRLDVASVLASLYPAGTILLAAWVLHERPTRRQVVGMMAALAAVMMITLPA